ncbi:hypothetical protein UMM65_16620 [Aureibaculum sp. 2210JD6-5]|uniref:hypothetical protein n=1 Tax=Aureibaculum sp. 2210JD6-5 TaxID=3103957 RepID=UPI002AAC6562|nr:hypothetical protein [Aureibaculum sp. 2210JD6-5]MDY7396872.1 hypothetical protein [Aureibaculum sp. 2210JD6-5]
MSDVDATTISEFSGGNARVAIALANTLKRGDNLNNLRDEELFQRLFKQRNRDDKDLLRSAQICSLVYSFEGTDLVSEKSELKILAKLLNKDPNELFGDVSSLKDRGMVQSRGNWRAILPHAIANRLAKQALNLIARDSIIQSIQASPERLIKSFSRRLSFLHDEEIAIQIAQLWLGLDGWIGKSMGNLNSLGISVFKNVAPISPEFTLESIEREANSDYGEKFTSRTNSYYYEFVQILALIAYDKKLFHRSTELIIRFALAENPKENYNSTRDVLKGLFQHYLSGTNANYVEKLSVIEKLFEHQDSTRNQLGILLLDGCLGTYHYSSIYPHQFGARSRDYGYQPNTENEYKEWYRTFVQLCGIYGHKNSDLGKDVRLIFANHLRGLISVKIFELLDQTIIGFHSNYIWNEGWLAIK